MYKKDNNRYPEIASDLANLFNTLSDRTRVLIIDAR